MSHISIQGASRSDHARSQARMEWSNDICSRWSNILGANRRLANAKSAMLQENNPDAACMYVYTRSTYFDMYSGRHVLCLLFCAGVTALCYAVLCCAVLAVLL